jgi:hypothetical protein
MIPKLETRLARLEAKLKPRALGALIQGFFAKSPGSDGSYDVPGALSSDDPRLQQGVNSDGEAFVSRWWTVTFFEGSPEQQNARLKELRLDPRFQKPWNEDDIPAHFEGGARVDDMLARLHEKDVASHTKGSF